MRQNRRMRWIFWEWATNSSIAILSLNLCGKQQVAIDWISRCFLEDADAVFLRKPCKISESTRALGNALRLSSGQRVAMSSRDFYMEKLIALTAVRIAV